MKIYCLLLCHISNYNIHKYIMSQYYKCQYDENNYSFKNPKMLVNSYNIFAFSRIKLILMLSCYGVFNNIIDSLSYSCVKNAKWLIYDLIIVFFEYGNHTWLERILMKIHYDNLVIIINHGIDTVIFEKMLKKYITSNINKKYVELLMSYVHKYDINWNAILYSNDVLNTYITNINKY